MRIIIFIVLFLPTIYFSYEIFYLQNANDPIKYIYTITGAISISLLFLTTSISLIKKRINLMKYRRMIGLYSFYYAFLHMMNFLILDMELDFLFALEETLDKPFIYLGMISFIILCFMTLTSTKELFAKFNKKHKIVYLALLFLSIHFIMAQKSLSLEQWLYLSIIIMIIYQKVIKIKKIIFHA